MTEPSELHLAEVRHNYRKLYGYIGFEAMIQLMYDMLKLAEVIGEVIVEEKAKESR